MARRPAVGPRGRTAAVHPVDLGDLGRRRGRGRGRRPERPRRRGLAAARYLCADGHDLTTGAGWADAVFSYNHAQAYVDAVHAAATSYAERTD